MPVGHNFKVEAYKNRENHGDLPPYAHVHIVNFCHDSRDFGSQLFLQA